MIKVGVDIGNSKISIIVCDVKSNGLKKVLSFISNPTNNVKKSLVTNLISIKDEISKTINNAAKESQTDIKSINLNLPAVNSLSQYSNSEINISEEKIVQFEIPTGNPLLIRFEDNLKIKDYKYLDIKRAKKILFNI